MSVTSCCYAILCCSMCLFLYGQFCKNALKLDQSTLFTTYYFEHLLNVCLANLSIQ